MSLPRERSSRTGIVRRCPAAFLLLIALTVLSACSGDDDSVADPTSTTRPTASTTTTEAEDPVATEIANRYERFWEVRLAANREPVNPDDSRLAELAINSQLDQVVTETRQRREQGLALRSPESSVTEHRVKVVRVDGDAASVQDCITDGDIVYRVATGETIDDKVVTRNVMATMRRVDGVWKLADTRVVQTWEGVAGCALSPES